MLDVHELREQLSLNYDSLDRVRRCAVGSVIAALTLSSCGIGSSSTTEARPIAVVSEAGITACAAEGEPVVTSEQRLCVDRREGDLLTVAIQDLESPNQIIDISQPSGDLYDATVYAADALALATGGKINFTPRTIGATNQVAKLVRQSRSSECVDRQDPEGFMAVIVEQQMPEVDEATQLVAFGGQSCENIGGVSGFTTDHKEVDVYNVDNGGIFDFKGQKPVTRAGNVITHELLHNYGLGHAGALYANNPKAEFAFHQDPSGVIDLNEYVKDVIYKPDAALGNVMAKTTVPIRAGTIELPERFLNQLQIDYLEYGIDPDDYTPKVASFIEDQTIASIDTRESKSPAGLSIELAQSIYVDKQEFSHVNFLLNKGVDRSTFIDIVFSTPLRSDEHLTIASIANIRLEKTRPLTIDIDGSTTLEIKWDGNQMIFTRR